MLEEKEINLNNPIFVYYFDTSGFSPRNVAENIDKIEEQTSLYKNMTFFIVPRIGETRIECIYNGQSGKLNYILNNLVDSKDFNEFKQNIRNIILDELVNGNKEKQKR